MDYRLHDLAFATLQSIPEAIVVIDDQSTIHLINDAGCHLLKTTPNDAVGTPFKYLPDSELKTSSLYKHVWYLEINARKLVFESSLISGSDEQYIRILIKIADETIEVLASELLNILICELRTPLGSISICVELLLGDFVGSLTDEQREFVTVIKKNAEGIRKEVNEIAGEMRQNVKSSRDHP